MTKELARMRGWTLAMILGISFVSGGASCPRRDVALTFPPPPPVLSTAPELNEVVQAVNRTSVIRELSSNSVSVDVVSMPVLPKLSATMSLRRDRDFRLRAGLPMMMGAGLDMGSNTDQFWFEIPEGVGQTLYYARHDQYQRQLDRAVLPVDPTWIMDAFGLVQIDPGTVVAGPVMRPDGKLEIRNQIPMPAGVFQRVCYIDAAAGHVTDQYLFSPSGAQIAKSNATRHQFYTEHQCALPHTVNIQLTPASGPPLELTIDVSSYAINQILSGDPNLFVMPRSASKTVDLAAQPGPLIPGQASVGASQNVVPLGAGAATFPSVSSASYQTNQVGPMPYRGLVQPSR